jgi:hypothetical protein
LATAVPLVLRILWNRSRLCGRLNGHRFDALVFSEHAEVATFELGDSRISKIWVQRLADKATVANFHRGWDVRPTTDEATAIIDFLAAGLADHTDNILDA